MPPDAKQDHYSLFFIKDSGIGFNMADAENLFLPFRRLSSAEAITGNGIGLTTVQRIVHRHNGHIWATSQPGLGSTFFFTLPTQEWTGKKWT